jgi:tetratricopeptide (TPR) repeat protein
MGHASGSLGIRKRARKKRVAMNMGKRTLAGILLTMAVGGAGVRGAEFSGGDPFEPTVTREESRLLNEAMELAETNATAAVRLLNEESRETRSPALDFAVGNFYFQADRLDDAASAYRAALEKLPRFRSAIMNLGRVYLLQERTAEAIELYRQLVADGQADADILRLLGHALMIEAAPVSAEAAYRQSLLLDPKEPEALLGLAKALLLQERFAEGLALVSEILRLDPTDGELWSLRANAALSMDRTDEAARVIEQARRLGAADDSMLATLGDLLLNRNQPEDALEAYEEAFGGGDPSFKRLLRAAEGFLSIGNEDGVERMMARAREALGSAEAESEAALDLLRLEAEAARLGGRPDEAAARCEAILDRDPLDGRTLLILADLHAEAGRMEEGVIACERAARIPGFEADALVRQAQIEVERSRYRRAAELLEASLAFEDRPRVARYLEQVRRLAD